MKKILFAFLINLFMVSGVYADTTVEVSEQEFLYVNNVSPSTCRDYEGLYYYSNFYSFISNSNHKEIFDKLYTELMDKYYNELQSSYPYYTLSVNIFSDNSNYFNLKSITLELEAYNSFNGNGSLYHNYYNSYNTTTLYSGVEEGRTACDDTHITLLSISEPLFYNDTTWYYLPLSKFESNLENPIGTIDDSGIITFNVYDSNFKFISTYNSSSIQPTYLEGTYKDYINNMYTSVYLDNYEYVILSLKDYSQTVAFSSNLRVKGMVGITPVYEFGTIEKTNVTDRCNFSYSELTDYTLYILSSDLTNNAVYYVKPCESGSILEFDNKVFDITYITAETVNDPVITVGGIDYHVIPFNKLGTTANSNEENNFVPGANQQFDPFGDAVDYISSFWNSLTTFMGLVTKFFNTLPIEIRAISITMFTTAITLGVIKFIKS